MGGHERPSVLLPVNLSDLSFSLLSRGHMLRVLLQDRI